jgi:hypothetical protein
MGFVGFFCGGGLFLLNTADLDAVYWCGEGVVVLEGVIGCDCAVLGNLDK